MKALSRTGIVCEIEPQSGHPEVEVVKRLEEIIFCPKCGFSQQQGGSCEACGLVFDKYRTALRKSEDSFFAVPPAKTPVTPQSSGSGWFKLIVAAAVFAMIGYFSLASVGKPDRDEIVLYTANSCGPCDMAKKFFTDKGVSYVEINIEESDENMTKFNHYNVDSLPLAFIGGEQVAGFNQIAYGIAVDGFLGRQNGNLNKRIVMYSQPGCPGCKKARDFFNDQDIAFEEYDINDPAHRSEYRRYSPLGTPLILVGGIRLDGFSKPAIEMALRQMGEL